MQNRDKAGNKNLAGKVNKMGTSMKKIGEENIYTEYKEYLPSV